MKLNLRFVFFEMKYTLATLILKTIHILSIEDKFVKHKISFIKFRYMQQKADRQISIYKKIHSIISFRKMTL